MLKFISFGSGSSHSAAEVVVTATISRPGLKDY